MSARAPRPDRHSCRPRRLDAVATDLVANLRFHREVEKLRCEVAKLVCQRGAMVSSL
jgi:hypothetical protein